MRSSRAARAAVLSGTLAVLAIPAGVAASQVTRFRLLETLYVVVPAALLLGLGALAASRRARFAASRSVVARGRFGLRLARLVAWAGLYAGVTGGLALAVYGVLRWAQ